MADHPDYGRAFALWRQATGGAWDSYARHAFVEGLKDGTLPRKAFLHYLVQDYVFLIHFSRAWALAVVKAESLDELKIAAGTVNALVNFEMQLHVKICAEHGISEDQLYAAEEEFANLAYTRYVLDAGQNGDLLDLLAALMPCVLGYGEIGERLGREAVSGTPYQPWIDTYASEDYQSVCRDVGAMLDGAAARRIGEDFEASPRWQRLCDRFVMATKLEAGFWDMGLEGA
ncbi:MAG: thiaminase II [Cohaesibacter sp.]|jgi:thiaminase/transcriptional activator TenA|nr:thiaminase II [Cohaesibacter sp.]